MKAVLITIPRAARVRRETLKSKRPPKRSSVSGESAGGDVGADSIMRGDAIDGPRRRLRRHTGPGYSGRVVAVSVIVPARDAEATLPRTLAALSRQDLGTGYEVVVVDDGSRDRTAEIALAAGAPVTLLTQDQSGPAIARNLAVARARGAALAFCDADVYPTESWLRHGLRALRDAEIVRGRVLPDPTVPIGPFDRTIWVTSEAGLWEAANLFMTRELFERVGGFCESLGPAGGKPLGEDVLLGYRARRLGARSAFCQEALAHHAVFKRGWRAYVAERRRLEHFPELARRVPELRRDFFYRHLFLNARSARFDLALTGLALAAARRSPAPAVAALPYLRALRGQARRSPSSEPGTAAVAAADLAADAVGLAAMLWGSVRYRSPLL